MWCNAGVGDVKTGCRKPCLTRPLLELICTWLMKDPQLCLVSLRHSQAAAAGAEAQRATLWTSPTKPNTQTPVPGLIKWCTKAPLVMFVICCVSVHYRAVNALIVKVVTTCPRIVDYVFSQSLYGLHAYVVCSWQWTLLSNVLWYYYIVSRNESTTFLAVTWAITIQFLPVWR